MQECFYFSMLILLVVDSSVHFLWHSRSLTVFSSVPGSQTQANIQPVWVCWYSSEDPPAHWCVVRPSPLSHQSRCYPSPLLHLWWSGAAALSTTLHLRNSACDRPNTHTHTNGNIPPDPTEPVWMWWWRQPDALLSLICHVWNYLICCLSLPAALSSLWDVTLESFQLFPSLFLQKCQIPNGIRSSTDKEIQWTVCPVRAGSLYDNPPKVLVALKQLKTMRLLFDSSHCPSVKPIFDMPKHT